MANVDVTVLESDGVTEKTVRTLDFGRQAAAASKSLTLSTEDKAVLDSLATKLDTVITAVQIIDNSISGSETQVDVVAALPAGTNNIGEVTIDATQLDPLVAHDDADSGSPYKFGAKAIAGLSTATLVAAADRTNIYAGLDGALIMRPHCGLEDLISGVAAITDGSSTSVIASAGAGVKNYITSVIIANNSATAVTVDLRDGAAGSVKATLPVPANTSGVVCNFPVPLGFSAATAVCADPSAAATTVTVTLLGFKSKV